MTLVKWTPTRSITTDFDRMLNNIFNDGWNGMPSNKPNAIAVDVNENDKAFIMTADFPGFDKKDVSLKAEESVLTLSANRDSDIESANFIGCRSIKLDSKFELNNAVDLILK